jgi:hypothetical protein
MITIARARTVYIAHLRRTLTAVQLCDGDGTETDVSPSLAWRALDGEPGGELKEECDGDTFTITAGTGEVFRLRRPEAHRAYRDAAALRSLLDAALDVMRVNDAAPYGYTVVRERDHRLTVRVFATGGDTDGPARALSGYRRAARAHGWATQALEPDHSDRAVFTAPWVR